NPVAPRVDGESGAVDLREADRGGRKIAVEVVRTGAVRLLGGCLASRARRHRRAGGCRAEAFHPLAMACSARITGRAGKPAFDDRKSEQLLARLLQPP